MAVVRRKPEVMSPAGYWPQLEAAVEAGADSVYFGLRHFTARAKVGFGLDELPAVMRTLHQRGVRGFLTFNTLVFEHELAEAARTLAAIAEAGTDAIIVQDTGVLALAREIAPELEIHASTQMSITSAEGARLAVEMGVDRVTLARELSLTEIRAIAAATGVELEVFVHGALCVAYSGQCFSSEAWGGRSANRGQCAQACRLPYELIVDERLQPLADLRYLLSPGDLYALHQVPELVDIGVGALKIEGRYKEPDYVAATTKAYRQAVDDAWAARPLSITREEELQLEQVYSRGLGPFFLTGTNHQAVVEGRAPRHRGVLMGRVMRVTPESVWVDPEAAHSISPLKPGDGLVFDASAWRSPEEKEEGGRVFEVKASGLKLELRFGRDAIDWARIRPGDRVWRTSDPAIEKLLKPYTQAAAPVRKQRVDVAVEARAGEPLRTRWTVARGGAVTVDSPDLLVTAQNHGMTVESLRRQFERLGPTPYELGDLQARIEGQPFAAASLLNQLRRDAVDKLTALQSEPPARTIHDPDAAVARLRARVQPQETPPAPARLHLLVRTPEQLDAALEWGPASITLDYLDLYGLKPSVERVKQAGLAVRVATPRVLKPGEERIVDFLIRLEGPLLVRPAGLLEALRGRTGVELTGDFSLNAANALAAARLLAEGLTRITPTHDLNAAQITALARDVGGARLEVIAYQHLPVFHTEHCVFCRFLSTGTSFKDCGRPCEVHRVSLRDPQGRAHPLMADIGCRNTVFGAEAQEASAHLDAWREAGVRDFRLEFVHESAAQVRQVTAAFDAALRGETKARALWEALRRASPQGVTQGSLFVPLSHLTMPSMR
jgi:putative protease